MICPKDGTEMQPTYEPYEHRCPKCGYWWDDYTGKEINPDIAAEKYGIHLENIELGKTINQVRRMIEFQELIYVDTEINGEWVYFRYFNDENDPAPYQTKKVARDVFWNLDWSYIVLALQAAKPEATN